MVDGQSIVPTLLGKGKQKPPEYQYWELPRFIAKTETFAVEPPMQALRAGDWKIVRPKPSAPLELTISARIRRKRKTWPPANPRPSSGYQPCSPPPGPSPAR